MPCDTGISAFFFTGQSISLIGTWMQSIAMSWLVYHMTGSALLLGVVGFSSQIPTFILSPFVGVLTDRHNRHRIIILTQTLAMVQALILAGLTLTGIIAVWHIIALGIFLGGLICLLSILIFSEEALNKMRFYVNIYPRISRPL